MDLTNYLGLVIEDVESLNSQQAVELLARLLHVEGQPIGITPAQIDVPRSRRAVTTDDGGVDGAVADAPAASKNGLIQPGLNCYQVKSGDISSTQAEARKMLFNRRRRPQTDEMKPRIRHCFESGGTFTVFVTGKDVVETEQDALKNFIVAEAASEFLAGTVLNVRVIKTNQIKTILHDYPAIALTLKEARATYGFISHGAWASQREMRLQLVETDEQQARLAGISAQLLDDASNNLRVLGEAGSGKTRLVLEATRSEQIAPMVLYFESPKRLLEHDVINGNLNFRAIFVVDECSVDNQIAIWNKIEKAADRIKLVTIYNEYTRTPTTGVIEIEPPDLEVEAVEEIIAHYGAPKDEVRRWAEYCDGSPRVAHVIGLNLRDNPSDITANPASINVWERYIAGGDRNDSPEVRRRHTVLQWISLFRRFGFEGPMEQEARDIHALLAADTGIAWDEFCAIIRQLRQRKILQGEATLYITPKLLHIKLWMEWWENRPPRSPFNFEGFVTVQRANGEQAQLSNDLISWFCEMFKYAADSRVATRIVEDLLAPGGPFEDDEFFTSRLGADFFLALTEGRPDEALNFLERKVNAWTPEQMLRLSQTRQNIVWALERIMVWDEYYDRAVKVTARLALHENATNANNSTGLLADAFTTAWGDLSPTEANYDKRLKALKDLVGRGSDYVSLALGGVHRALNIRGSWRTLGAEFQGLKQKPKLFTPETYGEIHRYVHEVWDLLVGTPMFWQEPTRTTAQKTVLECLRELLEYPFGEKVLEDFKGLADKGLISKEDALQEILHVNRYDTKLDQKIRDTTAELEKYFTGEGYANKLRRFVGYGFIEDYGTEEGGSRGERLATKLQELAAYGIEHRSELEPQVPWLNSDGPKNAATFGRELALRDAELWVLSNSLEQLRKKPAESAFFLSGYLSGVKQVDEETWARYALAIADDEKLAKYYPEIVWRNGPTEQTTARLTKMLQRGVFKPASLRMFRLGGVLSALSQKHMNIWIELLSGSDAPLLDVATAIDFAHYYYVGNKDKSNDIVLPEELGYKLLTHPALIGGDGENEPNFDQMLDYYWTQMAKAFIKLYPEKSIPLAGFLWAHKGERGTLFDGFHNETDEVLTLVASSQPTETWVALSKYIETEPRNIYRITSWLEGTKSWFGGVSEAGALQYFPKEPVLSWANKDLPERAVFLAGCVPHDYFFDTDRVCWAREILIAYGDNQQVRNRLRATFGSEGWSGPASNYYTQKLHTFEDFLEKETDENARVWLNEEIRGIKYRIESSKIEEERRGF